jgi:hypothetical protein
LGGAIPLCKFHSQSQQNILHDKYHVIPSAYLGLACFAAATGMRFALFFISTTSDTKIGF